MTFILLIASTPADIYTRRNGRQELSALDTFGVFDALQKAGIYYEEKRVVEPSRVRLSFALLFALMGSLAISGCGGGGGSSTPNPTPINGDPTKAAITGIVVDTTTSAAPIVGATVSVAGTSLSAKTGADGKFSIINAPVGTVGLIITSPDPTVYYNVVLYHSNIYNDSSVCPLSVTTQASSKGASSAGTIQLFPSGTNPPPPPYTGVGCPK